MKYAITERPTSKVIGPETHLITKQVLTKKARLNFL